MSSRKNRHEIGPNLHSVWDWVKVIQLDSATRGAWLADIQDEVDLDATLDCVPKYEAVIFGWCEELSLRGYGETIGEALCDLRLAIIEISHLN